MSNNATARKSHRKSRKGCSECKRRHVKCDERRPVCSTCERLELSCTYKAPATVRSSASATPVASPTTPAATSSPWSRTDLELLHHYTTCCCVFVPGEERQRLWTHGIVNLSFTQEYLLHQILAVSALHQHVNDPGNPVLAAKAAEHRARALELVQPVIANMTSDLSIPIFAFAGVTMIYAFAELTLRLESEGPSHDTILHISECFQLNRGIHTVVASYREDICDSWAGELINLNSDVEFDRLNSTGQTMSQAADLHALIDTHESRPDHNAAYHDALQRLLQTLQILDWREEDHEVFHLINAWPSHVRPEFWQSLESKEPLALIVLAYLAVLLCSRPKLWWFQRWPELLIKEIEETLGPVWAEVLEWPKQRVMVRSLSL